MKSCCEAWKSVGIPKGEKLGRSFAQLLFFDMSSEHCVSSKMGFIPFCYPLFESRSRPFCIHVMVHTLLIFSIWPLRNWQIWIQISSDQFLTSKMGFIPFYYPLFESSLRRSRPFCVHVKAHTLLIPWIWPPENWPIWIHMNSDPCMSSKIVFIPFCYPLFESRSQPFVYMLKRTPHWFSEFELKKIDKFEFKLTVSSLVAVKRVLFHFLYTISRPFCIHTCIVKAHTLLILWLWPLKFANLSSK